MAIEEKFYKAFGIGKVKRRCCSLDSETHCPTDYITCEDCSHWIKTEDELDKYPEITDRKLLELICICSTVYPVTINYKETVDELKEFILDFCIRHSKELGIKQICELFEE